MGREVLKPSADSTTGEWETLDNLTLHCVCLCTCVCIGMCACVSQRREAYTSRSGLHNAHCVLQHMDLSERSIPRLFNIQTYLCMHVCTYVCMYVCMYECMYV